MLYVFKENTTALLFSHYLYIISNVLVAISFFIRGYKNMYRFLGHLPPVVPG